MRIKTLITSPSISHTMLVIFGVVLSMKTGFTSVVLPVAVNGLVLFKILIVPV